VFCTRLLATKKNQPRVPVVQVSTLLNEFNSSLLQVTFNIAVQWFSTVEYSFNMTIVDGLMGTNVMGGITHSKTGQTPHHITM
jgi:hypothetical protein